MFRKIDRKTLVLEYILIKLQTFSSATLLKKSPAQVFSCQFFETNSYSIEHLQTPATEIYHLGFTWGINGWLYEEKHPG